MKCRATTKQLFRSYLASIILRVGCTELVLNDNLLDNLLANS